MVMPASDAERDDFCLVLNRTLWPFHRQMRAAVMDLLTLPDFEIKHGMTLADMRAQTARQAKRVMDAGLLDAADNKRDPLRLYTALETLKGYDYSLGVKCSVHFCLFGGSVVNLGTQRHADAFVQGINTFGTPGSFCMTELAHGSDVAGVETTATYDRATDSFIIRTPNDGAQKSWIGNVACHGQWTVVFAQLHVNGVNEGVHVFIAPIRNTDGTPHPNVRTGDNGHKHGLLGIDNGRAWFDNLSVPRTAMLDRFAQVTSAGEYQCAIKNRAQRFATMIAPLVGGRLMVAGAGNQAAQMALYVAMRYGLRRTQFANSRGVEEPILEYATMQRALYPLLASTVALQLALNSAKKLYASPNPDAKMVHVLASGLKAVITWTRTEAVQAAREATGGQGFSTYNKIAALKVDADIDTTYEGDNTVLLLQVSRFLAGEHKSGVGAPAPLTDATEAGCPNTLLRVLRWYQQHTLAALIAATPKGGEQPLELATAAARAYVDVVVLETILQSVADASHPAAVADALKQCAVLFAQRAAMRVRGELVAYGGVTPAFGRKLEEAFAAAIAQFHKSGTALMVAESFGFPVHFLRAPIAYDYVASNSYDTARAGAERVVLDGAYRWSFRV